MMIIIEQIAGLGIRGSTGAVAVWVGASLVAAVLAVASVALAMVPYLALCVFALWRLTRPT